MRPLALLLRCQVRLALRGLPQGRAALLRAGVGAGLWLLVLAGALVATDRMIAAGLVQMLHAPHGVTRLAPLLEHVGIVSDLLLVWLSSVALAATAHAPDMALLAPAPLPPRTLLLAQAVRVMVLLALLVLVLGAPLVALVAAPAHLDGRAVAATLLLLATAALLPLAGALLLTVVLLRVLPPHLVQATTALLGPLLGAATLLVAQFATHLLPQDALTRVSGSLAGAAAGSPLAWQGQALAALVAGQPGRAALAAGGRLVVALGVALLAWALAADLFSAGWAAYSAPAAGRAPRRRVARTPVEAPAVVEGALPLSRPEAVWPALVGKEWRVARRDGLMRSRAVAGLVPASLSIGAALAAAAALPHRHGSALARVLHGPLQGQAAALGATLYAVMVLLAGGGLLVALLDAAWARELPVRDLLARAPVPPTTLIGALGLAYAGPAALGATLLVVAGLQVLPLPGAAGLLAGAIVASGLVLLASLALAANARWPARGRPAALVRQTLRARLAMGLADLGVSLGCGLWIGAALLTLRQPLLAGLLTVLALLGATALSLLTMRGAGRALDRLSSGA